ncbi:hypothetical protein [Streptomyces sp. NBC_00467]|uniref:hypothetical protein n=1 Tax=Streptomyces sp. NBC_00467 TaxID=2975752 RepID=UPI002E1941ED
MAQRHGKGEDKGDRGPATGDPADTTRATAGGRSTGTAEPVEGPRPKTCTGLNVVDGFPITHDVTVWRGATDPVRPTS